MRRRTRERSEGGTQVKSRSSLVTTKRPKGLTGRDQKVSGSDRPSSDEDDDIQDTPTGVQTPTEPIQILLHRQLGKPDAPHLGGSPTAREGDGAAGKRGRRKRKPPCNGADRAATAERPDPKGCRLPTGPDVGNLSDLLTLGEVRRWNLFHRTDLGTTSRLEEIHESGSTHQGSSRMRGNSHVRFLGGWGQATVPGYPRIT